MGILTEAWGADLDVLQEARARYEAHLVAIRDRLPPSAREFAEALWHYDHDDHRCPHDAWVERVVIREPARGVRRQRRRIDLEVRLLGANHDGHLMLRYVNVVAYRLEQPNSVEHRHFRRWVGHGDWLIDDVALSTDGFVTHEVSFRWGGAWHIECEDIAYAWQAGPYDPETLDTGEDIPNRLGEGTEQS